MKPLPYDAGETHHRWGDGRGLFLSRYFSRRGYQDEREDVILKEISCCLAITVIRYSLDQNLVNSYYTGALQSLANKIGIVEVEPSNKVDFSLAGEIKKVAIVYFIWENLLGNQYFIAPYYPMPERNIRFGLSWELFN